METVVSDSLLRRFWYCLAWAVTLHVMVWYTRV